MIHFTSNMSNMGNNNRISIVIPIYNAEGSIRKCIDSICQQDIDELEIICIDDGSTDNTLNVISEMADADSRIRIIHNEDNIGTLMSRKKGVLSSNGEYIMFADQDDWYETNVFGKLYRIIKEKETDILMYGFQPVSIQETGKKEQIITKEYRSYAVPTEESFKGENCLGISNRINTLWNKIIRSEVCKEAYRSVEDTYMTIAEDTYACMMIHYFAVSFAAIPDICYYWNCKSGVSNDQAESFENFKTLCECMGKYEKLFSKFLCERNETELLERFRNKEKEVGYDYCIIKWRSIVSNEDAAKGLELITEIYGKEKVYRYIHREIQRIEKNVIKERTEKNAAREEIKRIRNSKTFRLGKLIASPYRLFRKAFRRENEA